MGFLSKVELKRQLQALGVKVEGNYIRKKDLIKIVADCIVPTIKVTPNKKLDAAKVNEWYANGGTLGGDKADFHFDSCVQRGNTLIFTNVSSTPSITNVDDLENEFNENLFWAIDSVREEFAIA